MEKKDNIKNKQKEDFIKRLMGEEDEEDGLKIKQRAYKINLNSDKAKMTYAKQKATFRNDK